MDGVLAGCPFAGHALLKLIHSAANAACSDYLSCIF
jgi:hypothetical protein